MLCADASVPRLDIVGPYGLTHYLATMRGYTYRFVFFHIILSRWEFKYTILALR